MGANPLKPSERYAFGRMINGNYGSALVPNYKWQAYDGLNDYKEGILSTDSHSLISDHPVSFIKQPGVIRIFITGGSAAFGCIQARPAIQDGPYPGGFYTYNSSIAGILKSKLEKSFPYKVFEVVNCAVVRHSFQQNYAMYMASLHAYKPDMIINIDGYNDSYYMLDGESKSPAYVQEEVEQFLELEAKARNNVFPLSVRLANLLLDKYTNRMTSGPRQSYKAPYIEPNYPDYNLVKGYFVSNAAGLLWLIDSYEKQLRSDSIVSIFCLQPILHRRENQKQLSSLEKKLLISSEKLSIDQLAALYPPTLLNEKLKKDGSGYGILKDHIYGIRNIVYAYFFDDYLSPRIDSIVSASGGDFIDLNKAIRPLGPTEEFYVDFCHLTPFGSEFVAEVLAEKVKKHLTH